MQINERLKQAVLDLDIIKVRAILKRQINLDRGQQNYSSEASIDYALSQKLELFEIDNGKSMFNDNQAQWTEELWDNLRVELNDNFSKEKIDNIWAVMRHLTKAGHANFQMNRAKPNIDLSNHSNGGKKHSNAKLIPYAIGVVIIIVIGYLFLKK